MSRELKRVPLNFAWPCDRVWFGYRLDAVSCELCSASGDAPGGGYCPTCEGEGKVYPTIGIPKGDGYQMWETVSEGSPISPVFATPEKLAEWLAEHGESGCGGGRHTREQWLKMIVSGWAPSLAVSAAGVESGVEFVARTSESTVL